MSVLVSVEKQILFLDAGQKAQEARLKGSHTKK